MGCENTPVVILHVASGLSMSYDKKKQITLETITKSIAHLKSINSLLTLSSISATSKDFSPSGKAVAPTTILRNEACRALYELEVMPKRTQHYRAKVLAKTIGETPSSRDKRRLARLMRWNKDQLASFVIRLEHDLEAEVRINSLLRNELLSLKLGSG